MRGDKFNTNRMATDSGFIVWLTGLSSSGKTTLGRMLEANLRQRGLRVEVLDGEAIRKTLSPQLGFSKEDRDTHIRRIGFVSKLLSRNGIVSIVTAISPYRGTRDEIRQETENFVEVYLRCPVETAMSRDSKGLYERALNGTLSCFTGISDPYEEPLCPEVLLDTDQQNEGECLETLLCKLAELGYLP